MKTLVIANLVVYFPDTQIEVGDVPARAASEYFDAPNGVYNFAAYDHEINGETVSQPVRDWVGEEPLPGKQFTYVLAFDETQPDLNLLTVVEVISE